MSITLPVAEAHIAPAPLFVAEYNRAHGVHQYAMHGGDVVTSVSAPDWDNYANMLTDLPPTQGYIMSPELITCTGVELSEIAGMQGAITERTGEVIDISRRHPEAVIALGSAASSAEGVTNQLDIIRNGELVGVIRKKLADL